MEKKKMLTRVGYCHGRGWAHPSYGHGRAIAPSHVTAVWFSALPQPWLGAVTSHGWDVPSHWLFEPKKNTKGGLDLQIIKTQVLISSN